MDYRRLYVTGGTYFFTVVTYKRRPILSTEAIDILRNAFRYTMHKHPFTIVASVILPDHMHFIWTLPPQSGDYSMRWRLIKSFFTRNWYRQQSESESESRRKKREADIWQRRFWEHLIRDEADLSNHIEYIHYNPVKHGLVKAPVDWKYSSFMKFVREGFYALDWGGDEKFFADETWME
jgi:putative transposase